MTRIATRELGWIKGSRFYVPGSDVLTGTRNPEPRTNRTCLIYIPDGRSGSAVPVISPFSRQSSLQYFPNEPCFGTMHVHAGCAHLVVSVSAMGYPSQTLTPSVGIVSTVFDLDFEHEPSSGPMLLAAALVLQVGCSKTEAPGTTRHDRPPDSAVDAREVDRKLFHAREVIPANPGPLTLVYPSGCQASTRRPGRLPTWSASRSPRQANRDLAARHGGHVRVSPGCAAGRRKRWKRPSTFSAASTSDSVRRRRSRRTSQS